MRVLLPLVLASFATSLSAQDIATQDVAAQFGTALAAFGQPIVGRDVERAAALISREMESLAGAWVEARSPTAGGPLSEEMLPLLCGRWAERLERNGPHGFTLTRLADGEPTTLVVRYDYRGFRTFQRSADERSLREFLRLGDDVFDEVLFSNALYFGEVEVFHPSPDVLVIQPTAQPPSIYVRCPA